MSYLIIFSCFLFESIHFIIFDFLTMYNLENLGNELVQS